MFSFTFSPFWCLLKLFFECISLPALLKTQKTCLGHCGILRSEQDISACCCGIKRNSTSRRQNIEHFSHSCCVAALLSGRAPWSSKPSRVQPHRSWGTEYNKEYNPFANSLNPFFLYLVFGLYQMLLQTIIIF